MKSIHIALPLVLLTCLSTVMMFLHKPEWSVGLGIGILGLVGIYFLKDAIDWKYYQKHPPKLDPRIKEILRMVRFYKELNDEQKSTFETRLAMFVKMRQYVMARLVNISDDDDETEAPEDLCMISSIPAIILTFHSEDYFIRNVHKVVFYNHPFPSPKFHQRHHSEYDPEDKVLIFSAPHLQAGVLKPNTHFDLGMYEWSKASHIIHQNASWESLESTYHFHSTQIELALGLNKKEIEIQSVMQVYDVHNGTSKET